MADGLNLRDLERQISGYDIALKYHDVTNDVVDFNAEFGKFINEKLEWSTCCGWAYAIDENVHPPEVALTRFFELLNEFFLEKYNIKDAVNESRVS